MGGPEGRCVVSRVVDEKGAQVLPDIADDRATVTGWFVHLAADGDMRVKHPEYATLAASLVVTA